MNRIVDGTSLNYIFYFMMIIIITYVDVKQLTKDKRSVVVS